MLDLTTPHYHADLVDGVMIFRILDSELRDPDDAVELFREVTEQALQVRPAWILIDLGETKHLSGIAFLVMMDLAHEVSSAHGRLALCNLRPHLRARAQLLRLQPYLEIYDDEPSALASF